MLAFNHQVTTSSARTTACPEMAPNYHNNTIIGCFSNRTVFHIYWVQFAPCVWSRVSVITRIFGNLFRWTVHSGTIRNTCICLPVGCLGLVCVVWRVHNVDGEEIINVVSSVVLRIVCGCLGDMWSYSYDQRPNLSVPAMKHNDDYGSIINIRDCDSHPARRDKNNAMATVLLSYIATLLEYVLIHLFYLFCHGWGKQKCFNIIVT